MNLLKVLGYLQNAIHVAAVYLGLWESPSLAAMGARPRDCSFTIRHDGVDWFYKGDMGHGPAHRRAPATLAIRVDIEKALKEYMRLARKGLPINPYYLSELIDIDAPDGTLPPVEFHMPICGRCGTELDVARCPECALAERDDCPLCAGNGAWLECPTCEGDDDVWEQMEGE